MTLSTSDVAVCCCSEFAQFVEQPRVLDGDNSLGGEVLHQRDLFVGEGPNFLAGKMNDADKFVVLQHRNDQKRARARQVRQMRRCSVAFSIGRVCAEIGDVNSCFR